MDLFENESVKEYEQRALLVGVSLKGENIEDSMEELKNLAHAAGAIVVDQLMQNRDKIDATFFIGKGKIEEVKNLAEFHDANIIVFNDELSGAQLRNIEESIDIKVIDRTALILDIFALRAQSRIAKLQVELAQLKYTLPRLIGLGKSMSRTGGGIGTRGPGEQKLELDRRKIDQKMSDIKHLLKDAGKDRDTQRSQRKKNQLPIVALVGYTNSGKSTLMNRILSDYESEGNEVYTENMLFATLDTSVRKVILDNNRNFLLSDTVGFVSKLPHGLVEAFKATLEEVVEADCLVHVVDATNENYDMQIEVTLDVLKEIGAKDKKSIYVFNKTDQLKHPIYSQYDHIPISALTGNGVDVLINSISEAIFTDLEEVEFLIPFDKGEILNTLMNHCESKEIEYLDSGTKIRVVADLITRNKYSEYMLDKE